MDHAVDSSPPPSIHLAASVHPCASARIRIAGSNCRGVGPAWVGVLGCAVLVEGRQRRPSLLCAVQVRARLRCRPQAWGLCTQSSPSRRRIPWIGICLGSKHGLVHTKIFFYPSQNVVYDSAGRHFFAHPANSSEDEWEEDKEEGRRGWPPLRQPRLQRDRQGHGQPGVRSMPRGPVLQPRVPREALVFARRQPQGALPTCTRAALGITDAFQQIKLAKTI